MTRDNAQTKKRPPLRIQKAKKSKKKPTYTVGFRLDEGYLLKLENLGSKRGNSIHEQAREMVMALLNGDEAELLKIAVELSDLRAEVEAMREGLELVLVGLIHSVANATGEKLTLKEAQTFVSNAFRKGGRSKDAVNQ
jgi:hypothetical protein